MLQTYTCIQYTIIHIIHAKINLSTVKWAQWDKTQSRELLGLFIMCVHRTVHNYCTQYCTEQTWQFSLLSSRQSPLLRWCLFEGRGEFHDTVSVVCSRPWQHRYGIFHDRGRIIRASLWRREEWCVIDLRDTQDINNICFCVLLWSPYGIGQTIIFLPCGYFFFFFLA